MVSQSAADSPRTLLSVLTGEKIESVGPQVYFPLTADPAGYHHLLLAECALRQIPGLKQVVFILSNGRHPDPLKRLRIPDGEVRLSLLRLALKGFTDPDLSYPTGLALKTDSPLKLVEGAWTFSSFEFDFDRPVRLSENVNHLLREAPPKIMLPNRKTADSIREQGPRIPMLAGTDLLDRMLNARIFTDSDLQTIARHSLLLVVPRGCMDLSEILLQLQKKRGVTLQVGALDPAWLPENLRVLLNLSSTVIRRSVQAGQSLLGFMPQSASDLIIQKGLYRSGEKEEEADEWQRHCQELELELERSSKRLLEALDRLMEQGKSHTLSLIESGTGGRIAAAFTAIPGASRHLHQVLVPYSRNAQQELLGSETRKQQTVSQERAKALAINLQARTGSDWVLGETGMAGPLSPERRSRKNGLCFVALAGKGNFSKKGWIRSMMIECNPFLTKKEHQLQFSIRTLRWFLEQLESSKKNKN